MVWCLCSPFSYETQTKDLANRYERSLQESESQTEKTKARFDMTAEELERLLLQKEGEPLKDNAMQSRSPVNGKRVIGKAVAKGGMLLKGRNPQNVRLRIARAFQCQLTQCRSNDKRTTSECACRARRTHIGRPSLKHRLFDKSTSTFSSRGSCGCVLYVTSLSDTS